MESSLIVSITLCAKSQISRRQKRLEGGNSVEMDEHLNQTFKYRIEEELEWGMATQSAIHVKLVFF